MTTKFRVTFADGRQATVLDMEGRGLDYSLESARARFGAHNIRQVEDTTWRPDTDGEDDEN